MQSGQRIVHEMNTQLQIYHNEHYSKAYEAKQQECHQVPYGAARMASETSHSGNLQVDRHVSRPHPFTLNFDHLLLINEFAQTLNCSTFRK